MIRTQNKRFYLNILELYDFDYYTSICINDDKNFIDGRKISLELYKESALLTVKGKEIVWILNDSNAHLDYIGFNKNFRNTGLIKEIHSNCYKVFKRTSIKQITLKPLSSVLTMWLYFGFSFERINEEIRTRLLLIDYLKSSNNIKESDIKEYDRMHLLDIVKKHKEALKNDDFPNLVNASLYYSKLKKVV